MIKKKIKRNLTEALMSVSGPLQKLALYSKMQDPQEMGSRLGPPGPAGPPTIKEEDKELPPGAEYLSSRCVLFTYFQGDISAVVDEHFSRALSQSSAYSTSGHKPRGEARKHQVRQKYLL